MFGKGKVHEIQVGKGCEGFGSQKVLPTVEHTAETEIFCWSFLWGDVFFVFWGGLEKDLVRLVPPSRRFGGGKIFFEYQSSF